MNIVQLKSAIKKSYSINRPLCALSSPGIGKSSAVYQVCEELGQEMDCKFGMIEVRGSTASPSEIADVKYVDMGEVKDAPQAWVPTAEKVAAGECPERGFIFLDEIADAMMVIQSGFQQLLLDHRLGSCKLAPGWRTVAATNRAKDKAAAGRLSRALVNRVMLATVDPDPDVLFDFGLEKGFDHRVLAFLRFRPECINDGLEPKNNVENPAFCSPRSMHIASDFLKDDDQMPEALQNEMIAGILGDAVGTEFNGFVRVMDHLPNLDDLLKDPKKYPISDKLDVQYATIGALNQRANKKNISAVMDFFVRLPTEMSVIAIKDLAKIEPTIFGLKSFIKWSSDNIRFAV